MCTYIWVSSSLDKKKHLCENTKVKIWYFLLHHCKIVWIYAFLRLCLWEFKNESLGNADALKNKKQVSICTLVFLNAFSQKHCTKVKECEKKSIPTFTPSCPITTTAAPILPINRGSGRTTWVQVKQDTTKKKRKGLGAKDLHFPHVLLCC